LAPPPEVPVAALFARLASLTDYSRGIYFIAKALRERRVCIFDS